ncbi:DUF2147 domain-containing protein [Chitinophaga sancti]|uniref:DUF2147 domain-containing protein n=1 Tax=Chitinophaga sancti TaxID=1004 RepID=A0A1K1S5C7_9BACT|nr:DUF2147 domain-containing protein [Chitinophaga sancti]WQD63701.1 DUF2147 domain-containing protein [Chitinophaga sancti]WQG90674.1 DUF2147 domain-containing protein [Chitinophaga sancti]SFW79279.1 Uncharacterized conserved protein, DUF2147 family [Chitinophaga sancti]
MKTLALLVLLITTSFTPDTILGKWTNPDKNKELTLVKNGNIYTGTAEGKDILQNLVYNNGTYTGKVYLPKRNKTFPCTIILKGNDTMEIKVQAGFVSQTKVWTRVK